MRIDLISVGKNPMHTMTLVRDLGELSLYDSQKITENTPSSFVCNLPDTQMPSILRKFEDAGSVVEFTTGYGKVKSGGGSDYIAQILFREEKEKKSKKKDEEHVTLKKFSEIRDFLKKKSDLRKAIVAAIVGTVFLTILFSVVYSIDGVRQWWYDILVAVALGFSIKHAGRGVDGRFGVVAAISVLLTLLLLFVSFTVIMVQKNDTGLFESVQAIEFDKWILIRAALVAWLAFSISFTLVEKPENEEKPDLSSSEKIKDYIKSRKKEQVKVIIGGNESLISQRYSFFKSLKKDKKKKETEESQAETEAVPA
jgi:hypothetical protein